jgi:hypothetical protein
MNSNLDHRYNCTSKYQLVELYFKYRRDTNGTNVVYRPSISSVLGSWKSMSNPKSASHKPTETLTD